MPEWQRYVTDRTFMQRDMDEYYLHIPSGILYMDPICEPPRSAHNSHPGGVMHWLTVNGYHPDVDPRVMLPDGI